MAFVLGGAAVLGGLYFFQKGAGNTTKVFGDWKLACPPPTDTVAACALTQDIMQSGTGVTLVHLQLVRTGDMQHLLIVVPHGVLFKPGLGVVIGKTPMRALKYETCDAVGCLAKLPLDKNTIDTLRTSDGGRIVIVWRNGKDIAFPFSLRGFAEGANAFDWEGYKHGFWLGRYLP